MRLSKNNSTHVILEFDTLPQLLVRNVENPRSNTTRAPHAVPEPVTMVEMHAAIRILSSIPDAGAIVLVPDLHQ